MDSGYAVRSYFVRYRPGCLVSARLVVFDSPRPVSEIEDLADPNVEHATVEVIRVDFRDTANTLNHRRAMLALATVAALSGCSPPSIFSEPPTEKRWRQPQQGKYARNTSGGIAVGPSGGTLKHTTMEVGRNAPCPCGSGRKHKKCCLGGKPRLPEVQEIPEKS